MATPVGANDVTAIVNRFLMDELTDVVYPSNTLTFRWNRMNKITQQGGYQIEAPLLYTKMSAGGWFSGYQTLTITPTDAVKNLAWDWKFAYVPIVVDWTTLVKVDNPRALYNYIAQRWQQGEMEIADILGFGLWGTAISTDGTTPPDALNPDGLKTIIDNGTVNATYAGNTRAGFNSTSALNAQIDSTSSTLTTNVLEDLWISCSDGARHPTVIFSRKEQYARYYKTQLQFTQWTVPAGGIDEVQATAGFSNLTFNQVPWIIDSHVFDGPSTANSAICMLNEDYLEVVVSENGDFYMEPFQTALNQAAMVGKLYWAGNVTCTAPYKQGKLTNISA